MKKFLVSFNFLFFSFHLSAANADDLAWIRQKTKYLIALKKTPEGQRAYFSRFNVTRRNEDKESDDPAEIDQPDLFIQLNRDQIVELNKKYLSDDTEDDSIKNLTLRMEAELKTWCLLFERSSKQRDDISYFTVEPKDTILNLKAIVMKNTATSLYARNQRFDDDRFLVVVVDYKRHNLGNATLIYEADYEKFVDKFLGGE